jgi:hypothetical protein
VGVSVVRFGVCSYYIDATNGFLSTLSMCMHVVLRPGAGRERGRKRGGRRVREQECPAVKVFMDMNLCYSFSAAYTDVVTPL